MGNSKSLTKNLGWQTIYQIIATCMPLITAPYLSRVLGASMLGIFSYTYSLALVFRMFGLLGNTNYGTREISIARHDRHKRSIIFKELLVIQSIATAIALLFYFLFCICIESKNPRITAIQSIWIIDCFVNITWLYSGMEEFKYTALRGIGIKFFQLFSILFFVKNEQHLGRYAFIMAFSAVLSNLILWVGLRRLIDLRVKISKTGTKRHIKPTLILFIPVAAASVYHLMDKLMLGRMSTSIQSGFYYNSDHLVSIPILVITGLCTVMLSRMSVVKEDQKKYKLLFDTYSELIIIVATAMAFGIGAIAKEFVPFFFGQEFRPCIQLVYVFMFVMIAKSVSNIIMSMHLIPTGKDVIYVRAVLIGAAINLVFNVIFIGLLKMGALGATFGTLIAEVAVMTVELVSIKKAVPIKRMLAALIPYMIIGSIMFGAVRIVAAWLTPCSWHIAVVIVIEIVTGAICFMAMTLLFLTVSKRLDLIRRGIFGGSK